MSLIANPATFAGWCVRVFYKRSGAEKAVRAVQLSRGKGKADSTTTVPLARDLESALDRLDRDGDSGGWTTMQVRGGVGDRISNAGFVLLI